METGRGGGAELGAAALGHRCRGEVALTLVTIRPYDISAVEATAVRSATLASGIFPTAITATSNNVIIFQGWNAALSAATAS